MRTRCCKVGSGGPAGSLLKEGRLPRRAFGASRSPSRRRARGLRRSSPPAGERSTGQGRQVRCQRRCPRRETSGGPGSGAGGPVRDLQGRRLPSPPPNPGGLGLARSREPLPGPSDRAGGLPPLDGGRPWRGCPRGCGGCRAGGGAPTRARRRRGCCVSELGGSSPSAPEDWTSRGEQFGGACGADLRGEVAVRTTVEATDEFVAVPRRLRRRRSSGRRDGCESCSGATTTARRRGGRLRQGGLPSELPNPKWRYLYLAQDVTRERTGRLDSAPCLHYRIFGRIVLPSS
jgi:hypothetical protein